MLSLLRRIVVLPFPGRSHLGIPGRRGFIAACIIVLTFMYGLLLLHPFTWQPPQRVENAVTRSEHVLKFPKPGFAVTEQPPVWIRDAVRSSSFRLSLQLKSLAGGQHGPARIAALSKNHRVHNFVIGQDGNDLVLLLRQEEVEGLERYNVRVPGAIEPGRWQTIELDLNRNRLSLFVDGSAVVDRSFPSQPVRSWSRKFSLTLGNERSGNRPWIGEIRQAHVSVAGSVEIDYARPGELLTPTRYWSLSNPPNLSLLSVSSRKDIVQNVVLFVPMGLLLAFWSVRTGVRQGVTVTAVAALISLIFESLQIGFDTRYPSINDVLCNTIGAVIGLAMALAFRHMVKRSRFGSFVARGLPTGE